MWTNRVLAVCLSAASIVFAQESFEVASIKPHPGEITHSSDPALRGNRVTGTASTLIDMIIVAYHLHYDQISGAPGWAKSDHFDLEARAGDKAITTEQMRTMLQALLADRFQLKVHRETKEVPMYALVVAKTGPRFQESSSEDQPRGSIIADSVGMHMDVARGTMTQLANRLSVNGAGRPVLDRTGLTGIYTFKLNWVNGVGGDSPLPPLDLALQDQLGLKLESIKGPLEMLIIDHAERPSAN